MIELKEKAEKIVNKFRNEITSFLRDNMKKLKNETK